MVSDLSRFREFQPRFLNDFYVLQRVSLLMRLFALHAIFSRRLWDFAKADGNFVAFED
jgi:hypothetical protein